MAVRSIARRLASAHSLPSSSIDPVSSLLRRAAYSSGKRVLSEEESAAEAIYIKKLEQEKLEKLARKGIHPDDKAGTDAKSGETFTPTRDPEPAGDNTKNIAFAAAVVAAFAAGFWLWSSSGKKEEKDKE
ncbi:hypothetical protein O6H91_16G050000 [Diphasiastrum complanatum]|uniref:Uncharacterized protein n=1 Tax=Diphasiastrum complanatum TaxID=34168 RepID=A0ACC2BC59_DIPCM|nr:hypothetical protein O6H91_16G050000 [Diphasiastrum complanatum]